MQQRLIFFELPFVEGVGHETFYQLTYEGAKILF